LSSDISLLILCIWSWSQHDNNAILWLNSFVDTHGILDFSHKVFTTPGNTGNLMEFNWCSW